MNPQSFSTVPSYAEFFIALRNTVQMKKYILKIGCQYSFDCQKRKKNGQLTLVCAFLKKYLGLVVLKWREKLNNPGVRPFTKS